MDSESTDPWRIQLANALDDLNETRAILRRVESLVIQWETIDPTDFHARTMRRVLSPASRTRRGEISEA
jgi:hypothetical protein